MTDPNPLPVDPDPIEVRPTLALEAQTRGEVDVQITTARRYPRSVRSFIDECVAMATLDEDTAGACFYALPRDGKTIDGPSVRLAEIAASAWGHMRVQARIVDEDERFITARGEAWDIQRNVAIAFDVRRRITNKQGKRYSDDLIVVTGNAASSIALRNAIFKVIPSAFWRPIYQRCREVAVGKQETLANKRAAMLAYFQKLGVDEARVLGVLGIRGVEDIGLEHLATLRGLATAIKDGDTSLDEAFPSTASPVIPMPPRAATSVTVPAAEVLASPSAVTAPPASPPSRVTPLAAGMILDRIIEAGPVGNGWAAHTQGGLRLWTRDPALGAQLVAAVDRLQVITADPPDTAGRRKLTALADNGS